MAARFTAGCARRQAQRDSAPGKFVFDPRPLSESVSKSKSNVISKKLVSSRGDAQDFQISILIAIVTTHLRSGLSRFFGLACLTEPGFVHRTIAGRLKCQLLFIRAMVRCYEAGEGVARLKNRDKPEHSMSCRENVLSSTTFFEIRQRLQAPVLIGIVLDR